MTIEQENVVDIISANKEEKYIALIIADHLEWDEKNEKLILLQSKINTYLSYIESGQIFKDYPDFDQLDVRIVLTCMYEPNAEGIKFLGLVTPIIEEAGFYFEWNVGIESS
jgi:hypothetical protein